MTQFIDFKTLWDKPQFQCGLVRRDENRHWVNIMDIPYELQEWTPPQPDAQGVFAPVHTPTPVPEGEEPDKEDAGTISFLDVQYSRAFELYSDVPHPVAIERWATEYLRPVLLSLFPNTPSTKMGYKLLLPTETLKEEDTVCRMIGRDINEKEPDKMTWKEVVIYKDPRVIHAFNLVSHGRRMWRSQIYSSDGRYSLQSLLPNESIRKVGSSPLPEESRYSSGDFKTPRFHGPSLVILHRNTKLGGLEYYVPSRLLQGIIPSVLLETFRMWQGEDGVIRGEPNVTSQWFAYKIEIKFRTIQGLSQATVVRKPLQSETITFSGRKSLDDTGLRRSIKSPSSTLRRSISEPTEEDITTVVGMGFNRDEAVLALRKNGNNVEQAAEYLLDPASKLEREVKPSKQIEAASEYSTVDSSLPQSIEAVVDLLEGQGFNRVAAQHACNLFNCDLDLASDWLQEPSNQRKIEELIRNENEPQSPKEQVKTDRSGDLYLASLLNAKPGGTLSRLAKMLTRIEDMSHILIWTTQADMRDSVQLDELSTKVAIIELPRLKVKFQVRKNEEGKIRLYLLEQAGWFVSDNIAKLDPEDIETSVPGIEFLGDLLKGIENCLVLENQSGDLLLFVPNHDSYRPQSRSDPFTTQLIYDRSSLDWQQVMESRYYLYPVHTSKTFLILPTLGAALYMSLLRFLNRDYSACFSLLDTCHVDTPFTAEEQHIFDQFQHGQDDMHPDAHACRLKLSLAVLFSENKIEWKVQNEMAGYLDKLAHVSADCILSPAEELDVLMNCQRNFPELANRLIYLNAAIAKDADSSKPLDVQLTVPPERLAGQPWLKLSSYSREYMDAQGQAINRVQYDPPGEGTMTDVAFFELLWEEKFISGEESGPLGFVWLYELIKGDFKVPILGQQVGQTLGVLLTRYLQLKTAHWGREALQEGERQYEGSWYMAELSALMNNPGPHWPSIPEDRHSKDVLRMGINIGRLDRQTQSRLKLKADFLDVLLASTRSFMGSERYVRKLNDFSNMLNITRDLAKKRSGEVSILPELDRWKKKCRPVSADTSCQSHTLRPYKGLCLQPSQAPLIITEEDIKSFAEKPLQVLNLQDFITYVEAAPALLSSMPFDVSQHPTAQSLVAKDMLRRVNADVKQYSDQTRDHKVPRLLGLLEEDLTPDNLTDDHAEKVTFIVYL